MKKIILATLRDMWFHKGRSFLIIFSFMLTIAFPLAFFNLAPSLVNSTDLESDEYHLSDFDIRLVRGNNNSTTIIQKTLSGWQYSWLNRTVVNFAKAKIRGEWIPFEIVGIQNMSQSINELVLVAGREPRENKEALLHESVARTFNLKIGDELPLNVKTSFNVTIVGLVKSIEYVSYDLIQIGSMFLLESDVKFLLGYQSNEYNSFLVRFDESITLNEKRELARNITENLAASGFIVVAVWMQEFSSYRRGIRDGTELVSAYLAIIAYVLLVIGGFITYIITTRQVTEQKRNMGILYSFGFSFRSVLATFLFRTTLLGILGSMIGVILGRFLLEMMLQYISVQWGLISPQEVISNLSIVSVLFLSFLSANLFTLLAVLSAARQQPLSLLQRHPLDERFSLKLPLLSSHFIPVTVRYALRNLFRHRTRTFISILSLGLVLSFSFSLLEAGYSATATTNSYFENNVNFDVKTIFLESMSLINVSQVLSEAPAVLDWEPYFELTFQFKGMEELLTFSRGILLKSSFFHSKIIKGRWIQNANEVVLSKYVVYQSGFDVGDVITGYIAGREFSFTVVGIAADVDVLSSVMFSFELVKELYGGYKTNGVLIKSSDPQETVNYFNEHPLVQSSFTIQTYQRRIDSVIDNQMVIVSLMSFLGVIIAGLGIFAIVYVSLIDRVHEFAVLNAFGVSAWKMWLIILFETLVIISISYLLNLIFGLQLTAYWVSVLSSTVYFVETHYGLDEAILTFLSSFLLSFLTATSGFRQVSSISPLTILKEE